MKTERASLPLTEMRLFALDQTSEVYIIRVDGAISAGFPSPADDYFQSRIDLNKELIRNPDATFGIWIRGNSMQDDGLDDGDFVLVDRSLEPLNGAVAVCVLNDDFTVKRIE